MLKETGINPLPGFAATASIPPFSFEVLTAMKRFA
jgi:hypothetical protein